MKEIKPTTYISNDTICEKLQLKPTTFRKYTIMIDKQAPNGSFFERNERGDRLYTEKDVEFLEKFLELKDNPNFTLETAIITLLGLPEYNTDTGSVIATDTTEIAKDNHYITLMQNLFDYQMNYLQKVNETLEHKDKQIEELHTIVDKLIESQNTPAENTQITSNQDNSKSKWFNKLWK